MKFFAYKFRNCLLEAFLVLVVVEFRFLAVVHAERMLWAIRTAGDALGSARTRVLAV